MKQPVSKSREPDQSAEETRREREVSVKEREAKVKEGELAMKQRELDLRLAEHLRSRWTNPLFVAIVAATAAGAANVYVSLINGQAADRLEQRKWLQVKSDQCKERQSRSTAELVRVLSRRMNAEASVVVAALGSLSSEKALPPEVIKYFEVRNALNAEVAAANSRIAVEDPALHKLLRSVVESRDVDSLNTWNFLLGARDARTPADRKDAIFALNRLAHKLNESREYLDAELTDAMGNSDRETTPLFPAVPASSVSRLGEVLTATGCSLPPK